MLTVIKKFKTIYYIIPKMTSISVLNVCVCVHIGFVCVCMHAHVSLGYQNKILWTEWLTQQKCISHSSVS